MGAALLPQHEIQLGTSAASELLGLRSAASISGRMGAALLPQHEIQLGTSAASELGHQLNEARQMQMSAFR